MVVWSRVAARVVVVVGSLALTLAACSGGSGEASRQVASSAPGSSSSSPSSGVPSSAALTPGVVVDAAAVAQRMIDAMVAAKSGRADTVTNVSGQSVTTTQSFVFTSPTQADSSGSTTIAGNTLEIRAVGGKVYMKGLPAQLTGGKTWATVDPNGTDAVSQQLKKAGSDPKQTVDAFKNGRATVTAVSGDNTTYQITGVTYGSVSDLTMEITVDGSGRPVTSKVTVPSDAAGAASVTVTYSGWGTPVTVTAPPPDEVGTLTLPTS